MSDNLVELQIPYIATENLIIATSFEGLNTYVQKLIGDDYQSFGIRTAGLSEIIVEQLEPTKLETILSHLESLFHKLNTKIYFVEYDQMMVS